VFYVLSVSLAIATSTGVVLSDIGSYLTHVLSSLTVSL
jgi:hypothetical protein